MERFDLEWLGKKYPAIRTEVYTDHDTGETLEIVVASINLWNELKDDNDGCRSDEADRMDEQIAAYLEPDDFLKSDEEIQDIIQGFYD